MKRNYHRLVLCYLGVLLLTANFPLHAKDSANDNYFQERANLAMREIAHRMLLITGDSTTTIPPVYTQDGRQFSVRFYGELRYDTLRTVIDQVFATGELPLRYDLAIYDCLDETLLLGFVARTGEKGHPCQEREALTRCVDLAIRFPGPANRFTVRPGWFGGLILLIGLLWTGWRRQQKLRPRNIPEPPVPPARKPATLQLGHSIFKIQEQTIVIDRKEKKLTFREAKLLHYFGQHPNVVLPRDEILEAVWGTEGVQVTRSLDVFVSRLRKILQEEPQVEIANVHGVGYRMVVRADASNTNNGTGRPNHILNHFRD